MEISALVLCSVALTICLTSLCFLLLLAVCLARLSLCEQNEIVELKGGKNVKLYKNGDDRIMVCLIPHWTLYHPRGVLAGHLAPLKEILILDFCACLYPLRLSWNQQSPRCLLVLVHTQYVISTTRRPNGLGHGLT